MIERPVQGDAPERLRAWRGDRSHAAAALLLGISQSHYTKLEAGLSYPSTDIADLVCDVAGVPRPSWGLNPRRRGKGVPPSSTVA